MIETMKTWPEKWQLLWAEKGFQQPSPVQEKTYPLLLEGKDVMGISPTGSGKTLAYLLPTLLKVEKSAGTQLLILTSSQELGMQVAEVAREWGSLLDLKVQSVIGGANVKRQIDKLKEKPEVLVGTSGRVLELIKQKKIKIANIQTVIFDEADQLLTEQLTPQIIKAVGIQNQFAFFSATGEQILAAAQKLRPAVEVVDVQQEDTSTQQLQHFYVRVPVRKRVEELRRLANIPDFQGLVFFNELGDLGSAEEKLLYRQIPVASLASDQNKLMRKAAINQFKEGKLVLLLATDVAARGLDIEDLPYVVNYDVPTTLESYTHRAGRTGRMGKIGSVVTFVHDGNLQEYLRMIKKKETTAKEIFLYGGAFHEEPKAEELIRKEALASKPKKIKKQKKKKR